MINVDWYKLRMVYMDNRNLLIVIIFSVMMVFVSYGSPVFAQTAKKHPILPHPSDEYISQIKEDPKVLKDNVSFADQYDPNKQISYFSQFVITYLITKDEKYLNKIKAMPDGSFPNCYHHQTKLSQLATAYDWFYDDLTEADRSAFWQK